MCLQGLAHPVSEATNVAVMPIQRSMLPQRIWDLLPTNPSALSAHRDDMVVQMVDNLIEENKELDVFLGQSADDEGG